MLLTPFRELRFPKRVAGPNRGLRPNEIEVLRQSVEPIRCARLQQRFAGRAVSVAAFVGILALAILLVRLVSEQLASWWK